ncbi:tetratricopeptide repeat protein [Bartonella sp. HY406]|uniref:O-linked N-acetylglucosamine transferase, SPINDLY family protein n=1 Tax=Bartonella sp. HY406 TaxID=2979331 RepID=UPI0021C80CA3|nr:tetratricopeptide repeat protein [Bartonella sp. HY406]UXN02839.1 tetratricopeptide repeat protein [Bartonella sp. HY406]
MKRFIKAVSAYNAKDFSKAEELLDQFLSKKPKDIEGLYLRASCYLKRQAYQQAEADLIKLLQIKKDVRAYDLLIRLFWEVKRQEEALTFAEDFAKAFNQNANAHYYLGMIEQGLERYENARMHYEDALQRDNNHLASLVNSAFLAVKKQDYANAESQLLKAKTLAPNLPQIYAGLAEIAEKTSRYNEAAQNFNAAKDWGGLQRVMRRGAIWNDLGKVDALYRQLCENNELNGGNVGDALSILNMPILTPLNLRKAAHAYALSRYGSIFSRPALISPISQNAPLKKRLKIGYLSSDFYDHATMRLMIGVMEAHNKSDFDFHILAYNEPKQDSYTARLAQLGWPQHNLYDKGDFSAAQWIADNGFDIIVDLKGYTGEHRLGITAYHPAPIIVSWLGFPGTLGHERLADYIIGDAIVTPLNDADGFSEKLALMPHCYQPNDRTRPFTTNVTRADMGLPDNALVLCNFNQIIKFNPETIDLWQKILANIDNAHLWLIKPKEQDVYDNLLKEFTKRNIDISRITFASPLSTDLHLQRLGLADIAIDTFPYTSHTTASDALWAGVPIITKRGASFAARVASSLLTTHDFSDLICDCDDDYLTKIIALAKSPEQRQKLRQTLAEKRMTSPLFDTQLFAANLEKLYGKMWQNHALNQNSAITCD